MLRRFMLFLVAPLFAVTAQAGTKTLISAPIQNEGGGVACMIGNAGPKAVTVTQISIAGVGANGDFLAEPQTLPVGHAWMYRSTETTMGFCVFHVQGSTKGVRAATCLNDEEGENFGTTHDCVHAN